VAAWGGNTFGQTQLPEGLTNVMAIAAGIGHNLALTGDGTVVAWGNYPTSQINIPPANLPFVTAIAAGANYSVALTTSGSVIAWGDNTYGQTNVPPNLSNVVAIAAGYYDSVALQSDGSVVVWGNDPNGQTNIPPGLSDAVAIASGESHVLALKADGTVVAWGQDLEGEASVPPGLSNVVAIGAGTTYSLAVTSDGNVIGWGDNSSGQLDIPPGLSGVRAVAGGNGQSLALQSDGTVVAWGAGGNTTNYGQGTVPAGLSGVTAIAAGYWCNLALTFQGPIEILQDPLSQTVLSGSNVIFSVAATGAQPLGYQWFKNGQPLVDGGGVTGSATANLSITNCQPTDDGTFDVLVSNTLGSVLSAEAVLDVIAPPFILVQPTNVFTPIFGSAVFSVTVQSAVPVSYQWVFNGEPIANETNADLVLGQLTCAQSGYYNVIVSNADGALSSAKAELGVEQVVLSGNGNGLSSLQDFFLQFCNVTAVAAGSGTVYALKADGTVAGYIPFVSPASIVPPGLSDVIAISSGEGDTLALRADGTVAAWGYGGPNLTNVPGGLPTVIAVAAGLSYNLVLESNGTVSGWGPSPPPGLSTLSNVVAIAQANQVFLALYADGTVVEKKNSQPQLPPGLSNVIAITTGSENFGSLALRADGTVVGWDGLTTNPLPNVSNAVAIATSGSEVMALRSDGTIATSNPNLTFPFTLYNVFGVAFIGTTGFALLNDGSPVFTVQPANQFPTNGGTIWLHARAVGVQPMSYQWMFNGTNIPGATDADLTITNAQENDAGQYSALASNNLGSVSSRLAEVAIAPVKSPYTLAQALDATNLTWSSFSYVPWFSEVTNTHNGIAAAQSGAIGNSMQTYLNTTVAGPGTLTFWWSVSSEEYFDFLSFYIGNQPTPVARISGEVAWEQETFAIGAGTNALFWDYSKDPDVSVGEDAGWLSEVSFVPGPTPTQLGVPTFLPDGSLLFNVFTANGNSLTLTDPASVTFEASSNLVDWIPLTNALTLTNGSALLADPNATNSAARFYRLMKQ
jgi:alpha-tubulin suppressor-like RCC1 family protein